MNYVLISAFVWRNHATLDQPNSTTCKIHNFITQIYVLRLSASRILAGFTHFSLFKFTWKWSCFCRCDVKETRFLWSIFFLHDDCARRLWTGERWRQIFFGKAILYKKLCQAQQRRPTAFFFLFQFVTQSSEAQAPGVKRIRKKPSLLHRNEWFAFLRMWRK